MSDYNAMSLDELQAAYDAAEDKGDNWAQHEIHWDMTRRRAARDAILDMAERLDAEGKFLTSIDPREAYDQGFESGIKAGLSIAAAPLPASPSSVEG